jgi:hypothetical protein
LLGTGGVVVLVLVVCPVLGLNSSVFGAVFAAVVAAVVSDLSSLENDDGLGRRIPDYAELPASELSEKIKIQQQQQQRQPSVSVLASSSS